VVTAVLEKVRSRTRKWASQSLALRWWYRAEIETGIEQLSQELDVALQTFSIKIQIAHQRDLNDARNDAQMNDAEGKELLRDILADLKELKSVAGLHQSGASIAIDVMQEGQQQLAEMRRSRTASGHLIFTEDQGLLSSSTPSSASERESATQRYLEMERGLIYLHDMTGIPPTVKKLDGEIRKYGDLPVAGGTHSDIWQGRWLGEKKVALKALRGVKSDNEKAQRRFVRQITIWSELKNKNILQFYGIVTDIGPQIHMVSPWLDNGGILEYTRNHPDVNKLHLIQGAAEGLRYLHSEAIVHGNIKCSNILVSASDEACISDFGMAKVLEDVTNTAASTALTSAGSARWLAPEVIEGESPSKESDAYSFAMTILELVTGKQPLVEYKSDMAVIRAMANPPLRPRRPAAPEVQKWLTDDLWALLESCWGEPDSRPTMEVMTNKLGSM